MPVEGPGSMKPATVVADSASWKARTHQPLLSVVVSVHNTAPFVITALSSLVPDEIDEVEIVVVHDGGTDGALGLVEEWIRTTPIAARLLDQPNRGNAAARMAGLDHVTGRIISFLDSDDVADAEVRLRMARDCEIHDCDIVICRSATLDGSSLAADYFYDAAVWDIIMGERPFRRTTLFQEPRLLRLEPNTSQRVIRRSFWRDAGMRFPYGRKFEDMPAHVRGMIRASAVGLRNETGYLYRVNRVGQMTGERNENRMDGIAIVGEAVADALAGQPRPVTVQAGANLVIQVARMLMWHGQNVPNAFRAEFIAGVLEICSAIPASWYRRAIDTYVLDERERLIVGAIWGGKPRILDAFMVRRFPPVRDALPYALSRPGHYFARVAARRIVAATPMSRFRSDRRRLR